jgi:primosomal protein N' (replication factor Y)
MTETIAQVLVESPVPRLDRPLDYTVPDELRDQLVVGGRVSVPLGRGGTRLVNGYVVGLSTEPTPGITLASVHSVLGSMPVLTPALWQAVRRLADRNCGNAVDVLRVAIPKRAVRTEKGRSIEPRVVPERPVTTRHVVPLDCGVVDSPSGPTLRAWQQLAERVREAHGGVIVVLPDWRDVALMVRALVGVDHVVWDSAATPSERYGRYLDVLDGSARIVIGTRSAVYAPVVDLELLIVVGENDPLHDEPHTPYVHTRDAAIVRTEIEGGTLVFASLTPSAEVQRYIEMGFAERAEGATRRPSIMLANDEPDRSFASNARIPSTAWKLVRSALETGPVLVQVARPGYNPLVVCTACRTPHRCVNCRAPLSGTRDGTVSCRVCGAHPVGLRCAHCGGRDVRWSGVGSVRTAVELGRAFPGVPVIVADGEHRELEIPRKRCLVVSTRGAEPIVAGGYDAVLIVDGERELIRPSLRTTEDCLRWWGNAVSLAGDDATVAVANIEGSFAAAFATKQWDRIVEDELRELRALGFPPVARSITVRGSATELLAVRALPELTEHRILGPVTEGALQRITVLADYRSAPQTVSALRAYVVGRSSTTVRVHCDDPTAFDEPAAD